MEQLNRKVDYVGPGMDSELLPITMSAARDIGYYDEQDMLDALDDEELKDEVHAL